MHKKKRIQPTKGSHYSAGFQRVLYAAQILKYQVEDFTSLKNCPPQMVSNGNKILNGITKFFADCRKQNPVMWEIIQEDYTDDRLHDLSLLLETCKDVINLEQVCKIINDHKIKRGEENNSEADTTREPCNSIAVCQEQTSIPPGSD